MYLSDHKGIKDHSGKAAVFAVLYGEV